ncbi:SOS response-associated peptidase [Pedobacter jeongneungensis]|uniref:SOS response-associated peptidase n=1 Tax=Pedobacter jeongneungensis TaxID=947309 RepID=UPI0013B45315|nr:SOS response-associated peptidase [Pedobacter jeongneungensis]
MSTRLNVPIINSRTSVSSGQKADDAQKQETLPTDYTPVITIQRPREIQYMRWGLVPAFANDLKEYAPMLNARAETLFTLPSFRDLVMTFRCLILNEGFYESEVIGNERVNWLVKPAQEDYFYKAGLWTTWRDPQSGDLTESFTMITCDPGSSEFGRIHDRIPIIMNKAERRLWMNPSATKDQLIGLLKPCDPSMYHITEHNRKQVRPKRSDKGQSGGPTFF